MEVQEIDSDDCYGSDDDSEDAITENYHDAPVQGTLNGSPKVEKHEVAAYGVGIPYWDERYSGEAKYQTFEWLANFSDLEQILSELVGTNPAAKEVLHVGCGNSTFAAELYDKGVEHIVNIDNSPVVIDKMREMYTHCPKMQWLCMDACNMTLNSQQFDLVLDKCTLDAMTTMPDSIAVIEAYLDEVERVLKPCGVFMCISFGRPPSRLWCFDALEERGFSRRVLQVLQQKSLYLYVLTKESAEGSARPSQS